MPTSYEYIHYTGEDIAALDLSRKYTQNVKNLAYNTPNGLWLSITGIRDWVQYCLINSYCLDNVKSEFQIFLKPDAKILILHNTAALEDFTRKYGYYKENNASGLSFRWEEIIRNYQGIALPNVLPKLPNMDMWRKTWCYTCACLWDLQAVEKVDKLS